MIKIFCSDLDGSLLINNRIDKKTSDKLRELQDKGVEIALVSGRVYGSIKYLANEAGLNPYIIANNGALVKDKDGNTIYEKPLALNEVEFLIRTAEDNNFHYHAYGDDTYFSKGIRNEYIRHLEIDDDGENKSYQINIMSNNNLIDYFRETKTKVYKVQYLPKDEKTTLDKISKLNNITITKSGENNLEIMASGVTKWNAIKELSKALDINYEEVSAMGDYLNDLEMIENSGFGIAMGNAHEIVKEKSDFVTANFNEHGAVKAMDRILRLNR